MKNVRKNKFFSLIIDNDVNAYFIDVNENTSVANIFNKINII